MPRSLYKHFCDCVLQWTVLLFIPPTCVHYCPVLQFSTSMTVSTIYITKLTLLLGFHLGSFVHHYFTSVVYPRTCLTMSTQAANNAIRPGHVQQLHSQPAESCSSALPWHQRCELHLPKLSSVAQPNSARQPAFQHAIGQFLEHGKPVCNI